MPDEQTASQQWSAFKQLFEIVQLQQEQINTMFQTHWRFVGLVGAQFGLAPEPVPEAVDATSMARLQTGIDELEKMFAPKDDDEKGGES